MKWQNLTRGFTGIAHFVRSSGEPDVRINIVTRFDHNRPSLRLKNNLDKLRKEMEAQYRTSKHAAENKKPNYSIMESLNGSEKTEWRVCLKVLEAVQEEDDAVINSLLIKFSRKEGKEEKKTLLAEANSRVENATKALEESIMEYFIKAIKSEVNKDGCGIYKMFEKAMIKAARKREHGALRIIEIMGKFQEVFENLMIQNNQLKS